MDAKCIAVCVSPCLKKNVTNETRCRKYDIGFSTIIKPYFQWAECPCKNVEWETVEVKEEK